jgi:GDP-4-dehydro-6-deoxy-D-mannose reductase
MTSERPRMLLTGASGFVGRHLLSALACAEGNTAGLFAADRGQGSALAAGVTHVTLDVRARDAVEHAIRTIRPTAVFHLAAVAEPARARSDPRGAWEVNVFGTMNLAEAVLKHAPEATFVLAGSSDSYGQSFNLIDGPIDENAPLRPLNAYGTTKAAADLLVGQMASEGLRAVRFRPFNHTGPEQAESYVVSAFARQIARIEGGLQPPVIEVGNVDAERDFLDVRDVVRAYATVVMAPVALEPGLVLNLASGQPRRIRSILDGLVAMAKVRVEIRVDPARLRPNDVSRTWGSAERARRVLDWVAQIPFEQTLADVLNHWRATLARDDPQAPDQGRRDAEGSS